MVVTFWVLYSIVGFVISTELYCIYLVNEKACMLCIEILG